MSTRTIIEINHDYLQDLMERPTQIAMFLKALGTGLEWAESKKPYGIEILGQRHHSETLKLTVK